MKITIPPKATLTSLAKQYNTNVAELMRLNPEIKNRDKIRAGSSLNVPDQFQANAPARNPGQSISNPTPGSAHTDYLRGEITRLSADPARAGDVKMLQDELKLLNQVSSGQVPPLPAQTKAVVDGIVKGLPPAERDIVVAKAHELWREGISVEQAGGQRFAANLAFELSEYVATGNASTGVLERTAKLAETGGDRIMKADGTMTQLGEALMGNVKRGAEMTRGRETPHERFLMDEIQRTNDPSLVAELNLLRGAAANQLPALPAKTQAIVDQATRGMSGEERNIIIAKAHELVGEGYSVEKTSEKRFAGNLTLELSEYVATGNASMDMLERMTTLGGIAGDMLMRPDGEPTELGNKMMGNIMLGAQKLREREEQSSTIPQMPPQENLDRGPIFV